MSEHTSGSSPSRRRLRRAATAVGVLVGAWLALSMIVSVVGALLSGEGPVDPPDREREAPGEASEAPPDPATGR